MPVQCCANGGCSMSTSIPLSAQLFWSKASPEGRYELNFNGQPMGWLRHGECANPESHAHFGEHQWLFRRPGSAVGQTEILQDDSHVPIASYKSHFGGGTLTLADGSRFVLACSGVWNQPWSLLDGNGDTFLRVDPHSRRVVVSGSHNLNLPGEDRNRVLLFAVFVWHEILQTRDEAAMQDPVSAIG